jgi:hypothetical protein
VGKWLANVLKQIAENAADCEKTQSSYCLKAKRGKGCESSIKTMTYHGYQLFALSLMGLLEESGGAA